MMKADAESKGAKTPVTTTSMWYMGSQGYVLHVPWARHTHKHTDTHTHTLSLSLSLFLEPMPCSYTNTSQEVRTQTYAVQLHTGLRKVPNEARLFVGGSYCNVMVVWSQEGRP